MRSIAFLNQPDSFSGSSPVSSISGRRPRRMIIGLMLVLALFAFEMFNFDTNKLKEILEGTIDSDIMKKIFESCTILLNKEDFEHITEIKEMVKNG